MKAIVQDRYGPADVLELRDIGQPSAGDGEVLIEVRAAGVDSGVWVFLTGQPYLVRPVSGLRRPRVPVRGRDVAGVVVAVGAGVTRFRPGDEVYGTCVTGSYAEYAVAPQRLLAPKPPGLSFAQAAAVPISGGTALQAVRAAGIQAGHRVLITGAAGGVGSFAVQLAAAAGAQVTAVCSGGKAELVRSLGAVDVIDYTRDEVDRDGPVHDAVIDTAGRRPLGLLRRALTRRGTLVLVGGGHDSGGLFGGFHRQLLAPLLLMWAPQRVRNLMAREDADHLAELTRLIDSGAVRPVVDRTYPLAEAPDAIRQLAQGHPAGKIVVTV